MLGYRRFSRISGRKEVSDMPSSEQWVPEEVIVEQLHGVVEEAIDSISKATALPQDEVMRILEEVDTAKFKAASIRAIRRISIATDLNSEEISEIFMEKRFASMDDLVNRFREKSKADRKNLAS